VEWDPDAEQDLDAESDPEPGAEPHAVRDADPEQKLNPKPDPNVFKCRIRTFSKVGSGQKLSGSASSSHYVA
jgi:hypothetical protein